VGRAPDPVGGASFYKQAADQGHSAAMTYLGSLHQHGDGVPKDLNLAADLLRRAARQQHPPAMHHLGLLLSEQGADQEAAQWFQKAAKEDYAPSQTQLALAHLESTHGLARNPRVAFRLMRRAAEQGHPQAQCCLGLLYAEGTGTPESPEQAVEWYARAAEQRHPDGLFCLGRAHLTAYGGLPLDVTRGLELYRAAAEQSNAQAAFTLALMHAEGDQVEQSDSKAAEWFRRAADLGDADGMYELSRCLAQGKGVSQPDPVAAASWLERSAEADNADALFELGSKLLTEDRTRAVEMLSRAAAQGHKKAAKMLLRKGGAGRY
jgi:TPR repeat protein